MTAAIGAKSLTEDERKGGGTGPRRLIGLTDDDA
jgi:hypothetical protein